MSCHSVDCCSSNSSATRTNPNDPLDPNNIQNLLMSDRFGSGQGNPSGLNVQGLPPQFADRIQSLLDLAQRMGVQDPKSIVENIQA